MCILYPETDNCPSWISGRETMTIENISWSNLLETMLSTGGGQTRKLLITSGMCIQLSHRGVLHVLVIRRLWVQPPPGRQHSFIEIHGAFLFFHVTHGYSLEMPHWDINPSPVEPGYTLPLQTVLIQISWLLKKPNDLDLHCLPLSMWICINNLDQVIWLAEN